MRIIRRESPALQVLQLVMTSDRFHQHFSQSQFTVTVKNEDVHDPGENCIVRYDSGKTDLLRRAVHAEAQ